MQMQENDLASPREMVHQHIEELRYEAVVIDLNDATAKDTAGPRRWMLEAHAWIDGIPYTWVYQLEHGPGARPAMWSRGYLRMDPDGSWKWIFLFYEAPPGAESAIAAIQEYLAQDARSATRGTPTGESPLAQMPVPAGNQQPCEPTPITFYPSFASPEVSVQSQHSHEGFFDGTETPESFFGERNYYPADSKYLPAMKKLEAKLVGIPGAPVYIRPRRLIEKKVAVDDGYGKRVADRIQQLLSQHLGKRHRAQVLKEEAQPRVKFEQHREEARMASQEQLRFAADGMHLGHRRQEIPLAVKSEAPQEGAVEAIDQVRRFKRRATEHEASEETKKVRRVNSDRVPVPTEDEIAAILPSISRFDGGIEATAITLENGSIRCSACDGVYKDRSRWQRHAGQHLNGTVQCPFQDECLSERKFGRWVSRSFFVIL
jgi:hypothetical protein